MAEAKKQKVHTPELKTNMNTNLTGKHRVWIVIGIAWILFWLFVISPWRPYREWGSFFAVGSGPVAVVLAVIWIRRGLANDRKERERAIHELKQTVTCPKCPQVWHRAPGQIDFKCSRCGAAFQYCSHCGSTYSTD